VKAPALERYLEQRRVEVDAELRRILMPREGRPAQLTRAMRYAVLGAGKRIRPILAMAAAEAVGGARIRRRALRSGCAVEMIHAYSLAHDDLPAMDDDDLRRGKPSLHRKFDEATAILAGDALLTDAFELLAPIRQRSEADAARSLRVVAEVARGAGSVGMVAGQVADMASEGMARPTRRTVDAIHARKTGALIRAAVRAGALAAGADTAQLRSLTIFAESFGLAFQIVDDLLDETADVAVLGKAAGGDRARGKATYPAILGLDGARAAADRERKSALRALARFGRSGEPLEAILDRVFARAS
jgi:geranylgeranyl diphosphate synthase type II